MNRGSRLSGRRIVVTRPEPDGGPLATAISLAGARPVHVPLLRIRPVPFDRSIASSPDAFDAIVFTSANGVSSFVDQLTPEAASAFRRHAGVAVVGPATGRAVSAAGGSPSIIAPEHVAESLVQAMGDVRGKRVLWPRAESVRPVFARELRAGGAEVTEVVVYRTTAEIPPDASLMISGADAVTFTSPSGVYTWAAALGQPRMRVICIGPVTARAAKRSGFEVASVADPYTVEGVVDALCRAFATSSGHRV